MEQERTEITRGYTHKIQLGNYESVDLFCSQKIECNVEQAEEVSAKIYKFCRDQVVKDIPFAKSEGRKIQKQ